MGETGAVTTFPNLSTAWPEVDVLGSVERGSLSSAAGAKVPAATGHGSLTDGTASRTASSHGLRQGRRRGGPAGGGGGSRRPQGLGAPGGPLHAPGPVGDPVLSATLEGRRGRQPDGVA